MQIRRLQAVAAYLLGTFVLLQMGIPVQGQTSFVRIMDNTTPIPGGLGTFTMLNSIPVVQDGRVIFPASDSSGQRGIYARTSTGSLEVIVDTDTAVPGSSGRFAGFGHPSVDGQSLAFLGREPGGKSGVYKLTAGVLQTMVDTTTTIPETGQTFEDFVNYTPVLGDSVGFRGYSDVAPRVEGLYVSMNGQIRTVVDNTMVEPGQTETFRNFWDIQLGTGYEVVQASSGIRPPSLYIVKADAFQAIAGADTFVPGTFFPFEGMGPAQIHGSRIFFSGGAWGHGGIYSFDPATNGPPMPLVDWRTLVPGRADAFTGLGPFCIDGDVLAFLGSYGYTPSTEAIYVHSGDSIQRIIGKGDLLDGKAITGLGLLPGSLEGRTLAFSVLFVDNSQAVYVATVPEPATLLFLFGSASLFSLSRRRWPTSSHPRQNVWVRRSASFRQV